MGAYLVGGVPVGMLYLRVSGTSIRRTRTGNVGASEIKDHLGTRAAAVVAFGIFLQGLLPPLAARLVSAPETLVAAAAIGTIIGYGWQIVPGLGGGRGVGVSTGAAAMLSPLGMIPLMAAYALGGLTNQMGLATLVGFSAYTVFVFSYTHSPPLEAAAAVILMLIVIRRLAGVRGDIRKGPALRIITGRLLFDKRP